MSATLDRLPAALYHWSPTERRASIEAHGLRPGHRSIDGTWTPPYLCLATSPHHAWWLNLQHSRNTSASWDLWQVYGEDIIEPYPRDDYPDEIRTKHPVRQAYLIAIRDNTPIVPASMATGEDGIRALIARSSFGTREVQEAIASVDPERAKRLVLGADALGRLCPAAVGDDGACARPRGHGGEHTDAYDIDEWE